MTTAELAALEKKIEKQFKKISDSQLFLTGMLSDFLRKLNTGVIPISDEPLLNIEDLAEKLGTGIRFIRGEMKKGLPYHSIGGAKRFCYTEVMAYYKNKENTVTE